MHLSPSVAYATVRSKTVVLLLLNRRLLLLPLWGFCVCFVVQFFVSYAIILLGNREPFALLCLSSWYIETVIVLWQFFTVPCIDLQCVIVVYPDHTY